MKTNAFGEPIIQPGDDIFAIWNDRFLSDVDLSLIARFVEDDDAAGWSATLSDDEGNEIEVHDFESREAIVAFLTEQGVEIE